MPALLNIETRRNAFEEDPKWQHKTILRFVAIAFALIAAALFSTAIGLTNYNFVNTLGGGDWTDGVALAPVRVFYPRFLSSARTHLSSP